MIVHMGGKYDDYMAAKADMRININIALLSIGFVIFTFIAAIKPDLLRNNIILAAELSVSIPFILSSSLARIKCLRKESCAKWDKFASLTFVVGYGFLISSIGIMLSVLVLPMISIIFFLINIILVAVYSFLEISYDDNKAREVGREVLFVAIIILMGVLPALGIY